MNELPDKVILEQIAIELGVKPAFVEKDWFAVKVIKKLSDFRYNDREPIFGGGTSLSKGYGLIKRFSEDLDFKVIDAEGFNKTKRKEFRTAFIDKVRDIEGLKVLEDTIDVHNEGKNLSFNVEYPRVFDTPDFLRPCLKIELFFDEDNISYEKRPISSFVSEFVTKTVDTEINCILPFNTAADKFNALSWRIYNKTQDIDYTLLRHLHDLRSIKSHITDEEAFRSRVLANFESKDKPRLADKSIKFKDIVDGTIELLKTDDAYKKGYEQYVASMSYAKDDEEISFDEALGYFEELSKLF